MAFPVVFTYLGQERGQAEGTDAASGDARRASGLRTLGLGEAPL